MNVFITGNLGYVGSELTKFLKTHAPELYLIGYDTCYFRDCLTIPQNKYKSYVDHQIIDDVRNIKDEYLENIDVIVNLAAISNDPMGEEFSEVTREVNYYSSVNLAERAKKKGVKSFVFASSCSIYGSGMTMPRTETCNLNPLTEYARSKVSTENKLRELADANYTITNLRFSTACGMSDRFRMDLVLNDFVTSARVNNKIEILSDGSPWRPLINVKDMARAINWAIIRNQQEGGQFLSVNVGRNYNNFQVKELAFLVKEELKDVDVIINSDAQPDKRSYKVNFDLFNQLAPQYVPIVPIEETIREINEGLSNINFTDKDFRDSDFIRLKKLLKLRKENYLNSKLEWIN